MKQILAVVLSALLVTGAEAQKSGSSSGGSRSGGSSSSSGSRSGSSQGSSGSKYSSGSNQSGGSKSSSGSGSKASSGSGSSKQPPSNSGSGSKYSSGSKSGDSSKGSTASGSGSKSGSGDKASSSGSKSGDTAKSGSGSKASDSNKSGNTASSGKTNKDGSVASSGNSTSRKPGVNNNDDRAAANRKDASKRTYELQAKASSPPKSTYTTKDGKEVKINTADKTVTEIRNKPSTYFEPATRRNRIDVHVTNYHYSHPYDWYHSRPYYYVGGGYSSAFWWMMMEWDAERRANWLYHNRHVIEQSAYQRGLQDAEVQRRIAALEARNAPRQERYVDPEFKDNPLDMYDDNYIEAAYNPTVRAVEEDSDWSGFWSTVLILGFLGLGGYFLFFHKWGR